MLALPQEHVLKMHPIQKLKPVLRVHQAQNHRLSSHLIPQLNQPMDYNNAYVHRISVILNLPPHEVTVPNTYL